MDEGRGLMWQAYVPCGDHKERLMGNSAMQALMAVLRDATQLKYYRENSANQQRPELNWGSPDTFLNTVSQVGGTFGDYGVLCISGPRPHTCR